MKVTPEANQKYGQAYRIRLRKKVIKSLGGKCSICSFDDWRALQVDHVDGGGTTEVSNTQWHKRYKTILDGTSTFRLQLLCANCNWIKRYEKRELTKIGKDLAV